MGFLGYISESCPPTWGRESTKWHFSFNKPASKTVNSPTGPAPIINKSVSDIRILNFEMQIYVNPWNPCRNAT
jgi:hypothetical protein